MSLNKNLRKFVPMFLGTAALFLVPGCNTVSGIGEDLQSASDATRSAFSSSDSPRTHSTNDGSTPEH